MIDLVKIIGAAFVTAIACEVLRATKPELVFVVSVAGVIIILLFILDGAKSSLGILTEIANMTGMDNSVLRT